MCKIKNARQKQEKQKKNMKKLVSTAIAAIVLSQTPLAAQNFGFGTFSYLCHVVDTWGFTINDTSTANNISLSAYRIIDDGNGGKSLGDCVQAAYVRTDPTQYGYNCRLDINLSTSPSSSSATVGEQLALVVKEGKNELWRSYTLLPPVGGALDGACYVGGITAGTDANGDFVADDFYDAIQDYADAYEFTYGGANDDDDNDGASNLFEFYAHTDPSGLGSDGGMFDPDTLKLKDWSVDENSKKATVKIEWQDGVSYSIRYTTDSSWRGLTTGKPVKFSKTEGGKEDQYCLGTFTYEDYEIHEQQVWFTLPDVNQTYYIGIAANGVLCAYTKIEVAAAASHTITWLDADGNEIEKTTVAEGETPAHDDPIKAAEEPYVNIFTGWTPAIAAATSNATYTATFAKVADLELVTSDWTAADGDVITNATVHAVTVPAGASVTVNGVTIRGAAGDAANPAPEFDAAGKSATTAFTQGTNGVWTLTTFAELANNAIGADVSGDQIKVYSAAKLEDLETAAPMTEGVTVKEKKSAVKTTIEVVAPAEDKARFFKVEFGK